MLWEKDILVLMEKLLKRFTKFEIKSGRPDKDVIFKCIVKNSTASISFQDIEEQIEKMIKSEKVQN